MDEGKKKRVLIIEDEPPMLQALNDALTGAGFETLLAGDGEEGLRMALQQKPDIILLDILMPKIDGMTMMKKIREDAWGKKVPMIILTNVNPDSDATINAVVENQPAYYLIKSDMTLEVILEKVKEVLKLS